MLRKHCLALHRESHVRGARELFSEIKDRESEGAYHLSTSMCPAHRKSVLEEVRRRLVEGNSCRLVSTQLIEAGVDVDFPLVFRELAPFDSIIQAAGRCNREGKLTGALGLLVVFRSVAAAEKPQRYFPRDLWYGRGHDVPENHFSQQTTASRRSMIRARFGSIFNEFMHSGASTNMISNAFFRSDWQFRAKLLTSIASLTTLGYLSLSRHGKNDHWDEIEHLIESFNATPSGFRALATFQINLRCDPANPPSGVCEEKPGLFVWRGLYDPDSGWNGDDVDSRWSCSTTAVHARVDCCRSRIVSYLMLENDEMVSIPRPSAAKNLTRLLAGALTREHAKQRKIIRSVGASI